MKRISIIMIILSILTKLFGFLREVVLAAMYAPGPLTDAYLFSHSISGTVFAIVIAAFVTGFIPMFTRIQNEEGEDAANRFLNNTQNTMLLIGLVTSVFVFLFPELVLKVLMSTASNETLMYAVPFIRITVFTVMFSSVIQLMTGYHQIKDSFVIPSLLSLPLNFVLISTIILSKSTSVYLLPIGILLAFALQSGIILWTAKRKGFKFEFVLDWKDPNLRRMIYIAIPLIVGSATSTIGTLVNNSLLAGINGGVTYYSQALRIGGLIEGVFGAAIVSVMYPALSSAVSENRIKDASEEFENSLVSLMLFVIPCVIGILMLSEPIIQLIFVRGQFTMENAAVLDPVLRTFTYGMIAISINSILVRVYYSFQDMKTPMYVAMLTMAIQVVLGVMLVSKYGVVGATLSLSISSAVQAIILFILVLKKFPDFKLFDFFKELAKVIISGGVMGASVYVMYFMVLVNQGLIVRLGTTIIVAVIVYFIMIFIIKIHALQILLKPKHKTVSNN